jgi:hypothetical protein
MVTRSVTPGITKQLSLEYRIASGRERAAGPQGDSKKAHQKMGLVLKADTSQ